MPRASYLMMSAAAAVLAAACSPPATTGSRSPSEPLQVAGQFEVHSLEPATAGGTFTRLQVTETLVDAGVDGQLLPGLAERWQVSPDRRTWTFDLVTGAKFHDGTPVTAGQVVASLNRARVQPGTPLTEVPWRSARAEGATVQISLTEPFASLPAVLAHTSAQVLAAGSFAEDGTVRQVIGSGPYRAERVQIPSAVELVAAEQWRGKAPAVPRVTYQVVGRAEARALGAESGQADVTFGMDPTSLQRLATKRGLHIESATVPRTILLKVNAGLDALSDVRVRQALSLALNREAMATALLRDPEMAATQLFPPSLEQWHQDDLEPLRHDTDAAKELLRQAGWVAGPDGHLTRDGKPFALTLRTYPDRAELPVIATAVQSALQEVGISVEVQVGNSSEIPAGHEDGTLELGLFARNFSLVPDPLVTLLGDYDADGGEYGALGWSSPKVTERLDALADGMSEPAAPAARAEVAQVLQEQLPVVPVAWYRQSAVVSADVEGLVLDPLERSYRLTDLRWAQ